MTLTQYEGRNGSQKRKLGGFTLIHCPNATKARVLVIDYNALAAFHGDKRTVVISGLCDHVPSGEEWSAVLTSLLSDFELVYGYAHIAPRSSGPYLDACGLRLGVLRAPNARDIYESHLVTHWDDIALQNPSRPEIAYAMRSIYPLQFLTHRHFELKVGRKGLKNWILAKPYRGNLLLIAPKVWSWSIADPDDVNLVRLELHRAGLLWAWWPINEPEPEIDRPLGPGCRRKDHHDPSPLLTAVKHGSDASMSPEDLLRMVLKRRP